MLFGYLPAKIAAVSVRCPSPLGLQRGPEIRVRLRGGLVPFRAAPRDLWAWYSAQCHGVWIWQEKQGEIPGYHVWKWWWILMEVNLGIWGIFWSLRDDNRTHRSVSSEVAIKHRASCAYGPVGTMLDLCWAHVYWAMLSLLSPSLAT